MPNIDPNNTNINKGFPREVRVLSNLRPWASKSFTAPTKIQPNPPGRGIEIGAWVQYALDQGWITVSGTSQLVENAGPLSGAAPAGAVLGIDTTSGTLYYVSGGNWTAISTGGASVTFQSISNATGTVNSGNYVLLTASSSTAIAQFPASPTNGQQITVKVIDITNGCEIDGNGNNIDGSSSNFIFTLPNAAVTCTYNTVEGWLTS